MRRITLGDLHISERGRRYVLDVLDRNRLSPGRYTARFERRFARLHQVRHAVFCNSGTSALQIALAVLRERHRYRDGDEVLVPALTFISSSNFVLQNNMRPVFVDVDPETFNLNPAKIEERVTSRTRVILPVHLCGLPCDMDPILTLARRHGLQVLEDSAQTMFAHYRGRAVGSFGDLGCFSTHIAHILVGGMGGLVTTNDDLSATISRSLMAHGRDQIYLNIDDDDRIDDPRLGEIVKGRYNFVRVGYSYRTTELEAAIALSELEIWEENISHRRQNAAMLTRLLEPFKEHLQLPLIPAGSEHSFMIFPLVAREHVNRNHLLMYLEHHGIETRFLFPLLTQPVYQNLFPGLDREYPIAQRLARQGFFIGIHPGLKEDDICFVGEIFADYFRTHFVLETPPCRSRPGRADAQALASRPVEIVAGESNRVGSGEALPQGKTR